MAEISMFSEVSFFNHQTLSQQLVLGHHAKVNFLLVLAADLRSHRVLDAHNADASESGEDIVLTVPVGLTIGSGEISVREADGPQALRGHGLNHLLHHVVSVPWSEHLGLTVGREDFVAPGM